MNRLPLYGAAALATLAAWTVGASAAFLWGTGLLDAFPYPAAQWWLYLPQRGHPVVGRWLLYGGLAAALPLALAWHAAIARIRQPKPLHGRSDYASEAEAERSGIAFRREPQPDAILLGRKRGLIGSRYLCLERPEHVALYARTGAGKGISFVVPNCLTWGGSLVAFDIKGELYTLTAGRRAAMGQRTFFFAPTNPEGRSHRYNPFSYVPRGEKGCIDAIHRIMHILIPAPSKPENAFWVNSARALANGGAVMLAETPDAALTLPAVLRLFTRSDHDAYLTRLVQEARSAGRPYPQVAVDAVMGWVNNSDPRTKEGVLAELRSHLSLYASPTIAAALEESDFDLADIRRRGMSIYVGVGPSDLRRLRPLMTLLFQQMIDLNTQVEFGHDPSHSHRVLMMLDEFWAPGRMDMLADAAAFVRSYGLSLAYVVQTKAQLISIYGQEGSENLFQNTGAEVIFGQSDMKLCREVSERAGFDTVTETSQSKPRWGLDLSKYSQSESARRRALLLPQEVARLPEREQLIFRPGLSPLRTDRICYYNDPTFAHMMLPAPEVPKLNVQIARDAGP